MDHGFYNINDDEFSSETKQDRELEEGLYLLKGILFVIVATPLCILMILDF